MFEFEGNGMFAPPALSRFNETKCIGSEAYFLKIEYDVDVEDYVYCRWQNFDYGEVEGSIEINDSVIKQCLFIDTGTDDGKFHIIPSSVVSIECPSLIGADVKKLKLFINVTDFTVDRVDDDLSFLSEYKDLINIKITGGNFDVNHLNGLVNLKKVVLEKVTISNSNIFDSASIQLEELDLKRSSIESVDFLKYQYELSKLDLSHTNLKEMTMLGYNGSLIELILNNNDLTSIEGFEQFINLKHLNLSRNDIKYMSNLNLNNGILESVKITFNPLDCDDPNLIYSPIVKSSCNRGLKP